MNKKNSTSTLTALVALFLLLSNDLYSQRTVTSTPYLQDSLGYNVNSVHPIHKSDVMHLMTVWRRIDLREKGNTSFFAAGNEMTGHIMNSVNEGVVIPYTNDSLTKPMAISEFKKKAAPEIQVPQFDDEGNIIGYVTKNDPLLPSQIYTMEIREDVIFDKERSRVYYDIQSVELKFMDPKTNLFESLGCFKFKDLAKYFNNNPAAKWFNPQNRGADLKLQDAFDLRLFHSRILKVANPGDDDIEAMYSGKNPLWASEWEEMKLVERENGYWEY
jgi:gliding motility associated protien GldN